MRYAHVPHDEALRLIGTVDLFERDDSTEGLTTYHGAMEGTVVLIIVGATTGAAVVVRATCDACDADTQATAFAATDAVIARAAVREANDSGSNINALLREIGGPA